MAIKAVAYAINGMEVTSPDEEVWSPALIGQDLTALQKRSPYYLLEWRQSVAGPRHLDWMEHDNTTLESLTTRTRDKLDHIATFIDVKCQSVVFRHRKGVGNEVVATFLVNIDATLD